MVINRRWAEAFADVAQCSGPAVRVAFKWCDGHLISLHQMC